MNQAALMFSVVLFFALTSQVQAASNGIFASTAQRGIVILDNVGSNDADFVWDSLKGSGRLENDVLTKAINGSSGQLTATCNRSVRLPSNTSCTLTFTKLAGNVFEIIVDKNEGLIAANLSSETAVEVRNQLAQSSGFFLSPDKKLSICADCGAGNSQVQIVWTREANE